LGDYWRAVRHEPHRQRWMLMERSAAQARPAESPGGFLGGRRDQIDHYVRGCSGNGNPGATGTTLQLIGGLLGCHGLGRSFCRPWANQEGSREQSRMRDVILSSPPSVEARMGNPSDLEADGASTFEMDARKQRQNRNRLQWRQENGRQRPTSWAHKISSIAGHRRRKSLMSTSLNLS